METRTRGVLDTPLSRSMTAEAGTTLVCDGPPYAARQFNTLLWSGLSSEKVGTSISKPSPASVTIW